MTKSEISIIRKALLKIDEWERNYYAKLPEVNRTPSEKYLSSIQSLFSKKHESRFTPRRAAAIIIIAALIAGLVGCAFVFRKPILNFIEEKWGDDTKMTLPDGYKERIEVAYMPSYVPEGYLQFDRVIDDRIVEVNYAKYDKIISYSQYAPTNASIIYDTEDAPYEVAYIGDQAVYYISKYNDYGLIWEDGDYTYSMTIPNELPWEEVEKIILSIKAVES
ncbi:MAG: DUF4367 domain-containing protein [Clostridia bacterium]|nr:DUF4367 domain-containing protein [Clostridia bacterium]